MNFSFRLREERERLGLSQVEFGAIGGVKKLAQINYEKGEREPDASYLAAISMIGVNVLYVLTGNREGRETLALTAEEQTLLGYFRDASKELRKAALGVLLSGTKPTSPATTGAKTSVHVGVHNGQRVEGDMTVHGPQYFGAAPPRTKPK